MQLLNIVMTYLNGIILLLVVLLPSAAAIGATGTTADSEEELNANWYQVEIIVFGQSSEKAELSEYWRQDYELSYPNNMVKLLDPSAKAEDKPTIADLLSPDDRLYPLLQKDADTTEDEMPTEQPFTILAKQDLALRKMMNTMRRSAAFRPLFHKAWRQPLYGDVSDPAILVLGGDQVNQQHELQGYIRLTVSRYLHLETDLWLTQFEANTGQEQEAWPYTPSPPIISNNQTKLSATPSLIPSELWKNFQLIEREQTLLHNSSHIIKRTVRLNQKRRMRSNELHYIDHPLMGVLIQITPYDLLTTNGDEEQVANM